jgi:predicted transcriptional regulator YdeE
VEPKFVTQDPLKLVGFSFYGDPFRLSPGWTEENEIGRLWNRFINYAQQQGPAWERVVAHPHLSYEVHIYNEATMETGVFEVFVGSELASGVQPPLETVIKVLPAVQYAVFTLRGQIIVGDWPQAIYEQWLPNSDYELAHEFHIQYHDGSFKGFDRLDESSLDVYVPVKQRS